MEPILPVIPGVEVPVTQIAEAQPGYITLPAWVAGDTVISRWRLTWGERFRILLRGDLYHRQMSFRHPLQPIRMDTIPPEVVVD
jgi:hypothetical protein